MWEGEPSESDSVDLPIMTKAEMKREFTAVTNIMVKTALPDIDRFSSWKKLIRATAWVIRFCGVLVIRNQSSTAPAHGELLPEEL